MITFRYYKHIECSYCDHFTANITEHFSMCFTYNYHCLYIDSFTHLLVYYLAIFNILLVLHLPPPTANQLRSASKNSFLGCKVFLAKSLILFWHGHY